MEHLNEVVSLLYKYIREELTDEESVRLQNWVSQSEENKRFFERATDNNYMLEQARSKAANLKAIDLEKEWEQLKAMGWQQPAAKLVLFNWRRFAIAASLLVFTITGAYMWFKSVKTSEEIVALPVQPEVVPNTTDAILTLADGRNLVLDSTKYGTLVNLGTVTVLKNEDGSIVYNAAVNQGGMEGVYNTITAPKGSDVVYITLSDGTKVWLNAASSIRYPVTFTGNKREVSITGEAYFEVTHHAAKPFYVSKGTMQVQVLGTHFNINTYEDDGADKITLLQGSVRVVNKEKSILIKPGQQAIALINNTAALTIEQTPNIEEVMSWKNGRFVFNNTTLESIMAQVERWYNVEVIYEGDIKKQGITVTGKISRYSSASKVLNLLEETGWLHFTIEGKRITVGR